MNKFCFYFEGKPVGELTSVQMPSLRVERGTIPEISIGEFDIECRYEGKMNWVGFWILCALCCRPL